MENIFDIEGLDISALTKTQNPEEVASPALKKEVESSNSLGYQEDKPVILREDSDEPEETKEVEVKAEEVQTQDPKESPIKLIAEFFKDKGLIDYTDEEFRDDDEFIAEQYDRKNKENYRNSLPEEIRELIDNYEVGVPIGKLLEKEQAIFELSSITVDTLKEDSKMQEDIVSMHMSATGWSPEEITGRVKDLEDSALLEKEATRALPKLVQLEKEAKQALIVSAQQKKAQETTAYKQNVDKLQSTIKETKEFIDGVPTNDAEKKTIFEAITRFDQKGQNEITKLLNDPKNYIKAAYFLKVLKGDISKLKQIATTKSINEQKKIIDAPVKTESRLGTANLNIIKSYLKSKQI